MILDYKKDSTCLQSSPYLNVQKSSLEHPQLNGGSGSAIKENLLRQPPLLTKFNLVQKDLEKTART